MWENYLVASNVVWIGACNCGWPWNLWCLSTRSWTSKVDVEEPEKGLIHYKENSQLCRPLEDFIGDEGHTKLRWRSAHACNRSFPESSEPFFCINFSRRVKSARVGGLTSACNHLYCHQNISHHNWLHNVRQLGLQSSVHPHMYICYLQPSLYNVSRSDQGCSRAARKSSSKQQRTGRVVAVLIGQGRLEVGIAGEEDHGEGDVPEEAGPGALVQAKEAKLFAHAQGRHFLPSTKIKHQNII